MTQQPYPQQPYPAAYPAQYPQAPVAPPAYPQQPYVQQPAAYPPPAQFPQSPQAPTPPPVNGTLDDYYNQPSAAGGPTISWKDKPIGTTYAGTVARDVTNGDVQQQTNFQTKQPEFYRDGRPKFVMKVPLQVQPSEEFKDGEAALYVRGQMRDELVRAMSEAGATGAPKAGDQIFVTLVGKRNTGAGLSPANVFQIRYVAAGRPTPVSAPETVQAAPVAVVAPAQPQPVAPQPVQQVPAAAPVPPGFSAEQAELFARLTGQNPPAA